MLLATLSMQLKMPQALSVAAPAMLQVLLVIPPAVREVLQQVLSVVLPVLHETRHPLQATQHSAVLMRPATRLAVQ